MGIINFHFPYFRIGGLYIWMCDRIASLQTNSRSPDSKWLIVCIIFITISHFIIYFLFVPYHFKHTSNLEHCRAAEHVELTHYRRRFNVRVICRWIIAIRRRLVSAGCRLHDFGRTCFCSIINEYTTYIGERGLVRNVLKFE